MRIHPWPCRALTQADVSDNEDFNRFDDIVRMNKGVVESIDRCSAYGARAALYPHRDDHARRSGAIAYRTKTDYSRTFRRPAARISGRSRMERRTSYIRGMVAMV